MYVNLQVFGEVLSDLQSFAGKVQKVLNAIPIPNHRRLSDIGSGHGILLNSEHSPAVIMKAADINISTAAAGGKTNNDDFAGKRKRRLLQSGEDISLFDTVTTALNDVKDLVNIINNIGFNSLKLKLIIQPGSGYVQWVCTVGENIHIIMRARNVIRCKRNAIQ